MPRSAPMLQEHLPVVANSILTVGVRSACGQNLMLSKHPRRKVLNNRLLVGICG